MNTPSNCCDVCLSKQRESKLKFTEPFKDDLKVFFKMFDIQTMTEAIRLVYDMALYESERPIERMEKEALHQVQLLCEGLESLGKS